MKLLLVTDAVGGVWIYSLELARALRRHGVEAVLAVVGPSPTAAQAAQVRGLHCIDTGLPLDWVESSPEELRRAGEMLARIAEGEHADLVQTCSAALLADAAFVMPTIAVQHSCMASWWETVRGTPLPAEFKWRRDLVQRGLERANIVVAPTRAFARATARIYDLRCEIAAVHNGRTAPARPAAEMADVVLTAGRLWDEGKGVATLDSAAKLVDVPVEAAGPLEGPNGARGSFANLRLLGELDEAALAGRLAARPIFASTALYEPFGLSVLEAAQAGCALVLSDIPTFRELWEDAAVFVSARDAEGFAAAIQRLLASPAERSRLGAAAQARASRFTPQETARQMAALYSHVAAQAPLELAGAA